MQEIGYQHGIVAGLNGLRDLDPSKTLLKKDAKGKWPSIDTLDDVPLDQWKAWDKMERAFTILVYDHDAAISGGGGTPDPPDPPPAQTYKKVAPRVAYKTDRGDARYCMFNPDGSLRPGVSRSSDGRYVDDVAVYSSDGDGLDESGRRSGGSPGDCPTGSDSIDGRPYCSLPMQGDPTKNTGSWLV